MSEPTPHELDLIRIFESRVSDLTLGTEQSNPQHLLRWIRAREGDVSKAEEMLRRHVEWRRTNGIGPSIFDWTPSEYLTDTYKAKFCGYDKNGSPILLFTFGVWDLRPALARGEKANVIRYKDQSLEKVMKLMRVYENNRKYNSNLCTTPAKITQFNCICDWTGFSLRYIMSKEAVEVILEAARSFEANYPETLKAAYNVNCPKVFDVLFKLVKPFLSERTLSKIFIYDNNEAKWKLDVLSNLPKDQVPLRYGGTRSRVWDLHDLDLDNHESWFQEVFPTQKNNSTNENHNDDGYKRIVLDGTMDKVSIPFTIASAGSSLKWKWKTTEEDEDVDFEVQFEGCGEERESLVKVENAAKDSGEITCGDSGKYWVVFSNSSSNHHHHHNHVGLMYRLCLDVVD